MTVYSASAANTSLDASQCSHADNSQDQDLHPFARFFITGRYADAVLSVETVETLDVE
ncbi:hypothetical protein HK104_005212, partial [Borealophlyctis nickersoniae]